MLDQAKSLFAKIFLILLGIVVIVLGWQGAVGKGLAAFLTPGSLEVDLGDGQSGQQAQDTSVS